MTLIQALVMAILQGVTELFPVSSLGHAVILPTLFGWPIDQHSIAFLPFLVVLHLGTASALLLYFWRDWLGLALAVFGMGARDQRRARLRLLLLIVVATIPAVILGALFEKIFRAFFGAPVAAAGFLILNGFILFGGERLRRRGGERPVVLVAEHFDDAETRIERNEQRAIASLDCAQRLLRIHSFGDVEVGGEGLTGLPSGAVDSPGGMTCFSSWSIGSATAASSA